MKVRDSLVAVRADASPVMGLGHINRCLSLASALLLTGARVRLIARDLGVAIRERASLSGIDFVSLPKLAAPKMEVIATNYSSWSGVGWQLDAEQFSDAVRDDNPAWVVVDEYAFDGRWHRRVREELRCSICVIDDLANRELDADVLVDHNAHRDHLAKYQGRIADKTQILGGPRFALLGPAYADTPPFKVSDEVKSIGIFMGGVDAANLSSVALRACREQAGFSGTLEIVVTQSNSNRDSIQRLATLWPNTLVSTDLPNLAEFFARHDLQIGAGGGATWERCRVGVPTLTLITAANQEAVLPALRDLDAAAVIGGAGLEQEVIGQEIRALIDDPERRKHFSRQAMSLVDGLGAKRVALRLMRGSLSVRRACETDSEAMYAWRNHSSTRSVSTDSREISWPDHQHWMTGTLANPKRRLLVAHVGAIDVGIIRFDISKTEQAEVSLFLDPELHGLGLGRAMLGAGEADLLSYSSKTTQLVATVKEDNRASMQLFRASGYSFENGMWRKAVKFLPT